MNNPLPAEELQTHKDLNGKPPDQLLVESIVIVPDDQLVEVIAKQFKDYADVLPENNEVFDPHNILLLLLVCLLNVTEDLYLHEGLLRELGLVFDDLESHLLLVLVVEGLEDLTV